MAIPEIRVYSPSDDRDESNESINGISSRNSNSTNERLKFGFRSKDFDGSNVSVKLGLGLKCKIMLGSSASRSGDFASSENSMISQSDDYRDVSSPIGTKNFIKKSNPRSFSEVGHVNWENTFHMRPYNLSHFSSPNSYRSTHRSQVAINRARGGCTTSTAKSLDILRQNLQRSINSEINEIVQKYVHKFFNPSIQNIIANNGETSVSEQHVHTVCRQILEDAKKMYQGGSGATSNTPNQAKLNLQADGSDAENSDCRPGRKTAFKNVGRKRKESDTDSEASQVAVKPKKRKGRPPLHLQGSTPGTWTPSKLKPESVKREGSKWDPARLTPTTEFIMGAKANKALGLGATRGRLYIKHPDIFKYSGDQDDKQWLYEHGLMPATGGKAYMLLVKDIYELAETDEYRKSAGLCLEEIVGFSVSESILSKMKVAMLSMRTDTPQANKKKSRNVLSVIDSLNDQGIFEEGKIDEMCPDESRTTSPTDDFLNSNNPSPFSLGPCFEDVSPVQSKESNDLVLGSIDEPPHSAPFDVTCTGVPELH